MKPIFYMHNNVLIKDYNRIICGIFCELPHDRIVIIDNFDEDAENRRNKRAVTIKFCGALRVTICRIN